MDSDFEKKLQRQDLRPIPAEWRGDILRTAQAAIPTRASWLSTINYQLSTLLWPYPKAWAGLAAAWLLIVVMHFYNVDSTVTVTKNSPPPSPEFLLALKQQRRELAKLVESASAPDADRPKSFPPGPRSERREEQLTI